MQARAQAEIDKVVGRDRLPNAADEKNLPFTRAIIKVSLRRDSAFYHKTNTYYRKSNASTTRSGLVLPI